MGRACPALSLPISAQFPVCRGPDMSGPYGEAVIQ